MRIVRSIAAVFIGIVVGVVLTMGTDQLLHMAQVYPPWGEPMHDPALNVLALSYRVVFQVFAGYVIARLGPGEPMTHAIVAGSIGLVVSALGVFAATQADLGPLWYPIALAVSALPTVWLGAAIQVRGARTPRIA